MLIGPSDVPVTNIQQAAHAQKLVGGKEDKDLCYRDMRLCRLAMLPGPVRASGWGWGIRESSQHSCARI